MGNQKIHTLVGVGVNSRVLGSGNLKEMRSLRAKKPHQVDFEQIIQ
jgi:hypothetical protein